MRNHTKSHSVCITIVCLFITVSISFAVSPQIEALQKAAQDSAAAGHIDQAVGYCNQIIQLDPNAPTALDAQKQIVTVYVHAEQGDKAIPALVELKQKYHAQPEYVKKAHELGWDFVLKGDYSTGLQIYQELQAQFPNHERIVWFQRSIVQTYLEQGDMVKAAQAVEKLKADFQSHPDYANQMAITADRLRSKKQFNTAAGIYDTLLQQQPASDKAVIWKRMQIVNDFDLGQIDKAKSGVDTLFSVYKEKPEFVKQAHELGWDFVQRRDYTAALKIYTNLQTQFPNHERAAWFQRSIAQTYFKNGDISKALQAVEQLKTSFQAHPDYVNQMENLVGLLVDNQQAAKAKDICDTLLERFPNHSRLPWFLQAKARSQVWMKDPNLADVTVEVMRQSCADHPDYADAMSWTAYEYRKAGCYQRSIELYESLLNQNPGLKVQVRSIASIAQAYARLGNDTKVQEKVGQLLSQYGSSQPDGVAFYVFGIGEEYYLMAEEAIETGEPNQVNDAYQNALAVWLRFEQAVPNHNSPQYAYFIAITFQRLGEYEQAISHFQRVISKWPGYDKAWYAQYMIARSCEELAKQNKVSLEVVKAAYQLLIDKYPDTSGAELAARKLGSM